MNRLINFIISIFLLVFIIYSCSWFLLSNKIKSLLIDNRSVTTAKFSFEHSGVEIKGYPFSLALDVKDLSIKIANMLSDSQNQKQRIADIAINIKEQQEAIWQLDSKSKSLSYFKEDFKCF